MVFSVDFPVKGLVFLDQKQEVQNAEGLHGIGKCGGEHILFNGIVKGVEVCVISVKGCPVDVRDAADFLYGDILHGAGFQKGKESLPDGFFCILNPAVRSHSNLLIGYATRVA